jgi:hypothetical protein
VPSKRCSIGEQSIETVDGRVVSSDVVRRCVAQIEKERNDS